ncbi:MAG: hypothetical protein LC649_08300 [Bacteroidales bacterium]|nr:hypothetical protein [Bacteroidales bacterium]
MENRGRLAIVAGTGRNSGKTLFSVRLIERHREQGIIAVKISRHDHTPSAGSKLVASGPGYTICRESSSSGNKDSELMLAAGAAESYYISAGEESVIRAFNKLLQLIPPSNPIICESPVLALLVNPGLLVVTDSNNVVNRKEISGILSRCDLVTKPARVMEDIMKISLINNMWHLPREEQVFI